MNKKEQIEAKNKLAELVESQNELKAKLAGIPIENGAEGLKEAKELDAKISENELQIIQIENSLKEVKNAKEEGKTKQMKNYIESQNAVEDLINVLRDNKKEEVVNAWKNKLVENGVTVEGDETESNFFVPRKLVEAIETSLTDANPVYKIFRVTTVGALLISGSMEAGERKAENNYNRAGVHKDGEVKKEQSVVIKEAKIEPIMVYKLQKVAERIKKLNVNFNQIWEMLVAEMTQAIVDKIVELALIEGKVDATSGADDNGFTSIVEESKLFEAGKRERIKAVTGTADEETGVGAFQNGIEQALDFVRGKVGTRYLIVTSAQRTVLLNELRKTYKGALGIIPNSDKAITDLLGIDEMIVYSGVYESVESVKAMTGKTDATEADTLPPIVIRDKAFHVDMQDLTRIEAFKWETNENALLIETLSAGHADQDKAGAVITLP